MSRSREVHASSNFLENFETKAWRDETRAEIIEARQSVPTIEIGMHFYVKLKYKIIYGKKSRCIFSEVSEFLFLFKNTQLNRMLYRENLSDHTAVIFRSHKCLNCHRYLSAKSFQVHWIAAAKYINNLISSMFHYLYLSYFSFQISKVKFVKEVHKK